MCILYICRYSYLNMLIHIYFGSYFGLVPSISLVNLSQRLLLSATRTGWSLANMAGRWPTCSLRATARVLLNSLAALGLKWDWKVTFRRTRASGMVPCWKNPTVSRWCADNSWLYTRPSDLGYFTTPACCYYIQIYPLLIYHMENGSFIDALPKHCIGHWFPIVMLV